MEIPINTPALLFPAITLLMLAYTNRFLALATLIRKLHAQYKESPDDKHLLKAQIKNLRRRLSLIKQMQAGGILSFLRALHALYLSGHGNVGQRHIRVKPCSSSFILSSFPRRNIYQHARAGD